MRIQQIIKLKVQNGCIYDYNNNQWVDTIEIESMPSEKNAFGIFWQKMRSLISLQYKLQFVRNIQFDTNYLFT